MRSSAFRALGLIGFGLGPAILFAGCGSDEGGARTTLNSIQPSSYVVRPAVTTTTTDPEAEGAELDAEGRTNEVQQYEIVSGDYPMRIATLYGISLEELANFNEWTPPAYSEFPFPGTVIDIPPGALVPGAAPAGGTGAAAGDNGDDGDTTPGTAPETTLPGAGGDCVEGTHTIVENDLPGRVANQYDITLDELEAANAGNPAMTQFIVGQELRIPCPDDD